MTFNRLFLQTSFDAFETNQPKLYLRFYLISSWCCIICTVFDTCHIPEGLIKLRSDLSYVALARYEYLVLFLFISKPTPTGYKFERVHPVVYIRFV